MTEWEGELQLQERQRIFEEMQQELDYEACNPNRSEVYWKGIEEDIKNGSMNLEEQK